MTDKELRIISIMKSELDRLRNERKYLPDHLDDGKACAIVDAKIDTLQWIIGMIESS